MRNFFLGSLLLCVGCDASAKVLTQKAFTDEVIANIQSAEQARCVRRQDDGSFTFGPNEGDCDSVQIFTDNTYATYLDTPDDKVAHIELLISTALKIHGQIAQEGVLEAGFRENLVAIVRPESYLAMQTPDGSASAHLLSRPLAGDLHIILAHNEPELLRMAGDDLPTNAEMSESELFDIAFENSRKKMGEITAEVIDGVELRTAESSLISAELALPENCGAETSPYFAALIDRNVYMLAPADQPVRIRSFLGRYTFELGARSILSPTILHCEGGRWTAVEPSALQ